MKYIYLLKLHGHNIFKIGFTKNEPKQRIKPLQTGNPYEIELVASYKSELATKIESVLHRKYDNHKTAIETDIHLGGEWFELPLTEALVFQDTCKKIEEDLIFLMENSTLS